MKRERILALTSLPPTTRDVALHRDCIESWRRAGMEVYSFNHPSELATLGRQFDVNFVPVAATTAPIFGRHYVPINAMLDWANAQSSPVMIVNADIRLSMAPWQLKRLRWIADGGLCYFIRYNYDVDPRRSVREPWGIDAFLLHGLDSGLLPATFLSMGRPSWDFWLPYAFIAKERPVYSVEHPIAFHKDHPQAWSTEDVHRCSLELDRVVGLLGTDRSAQACIAMNLRMRQSIERKKRVMSPMPAAAHDWVQRKFSYQGPKTFLDLGMRGAEDTAWMARVSDATIHALEPDPSNSMALDAFCAQRNPDCIDLIRASVRDAAAPMIRGGMKALEVTRYLLTDYSDGETSQRQLTLQHIMDMLPEFRVLELWPDQVLLENRKLAAGAAAVGWR